ncbi:MAG TPA: diguanylate cyclase [Dissulfurispiraceae bacterium]|nr:diguanylate cyclase [Dissulfurispiraceae bacterium]
MAIITVIYSVTKQTHITNLADGIKAVKEHHPILKTQIQEHIGGAAPVIVYLKSFLASVNETYWNLQARQSTPEHRTFPPHGNEVYQSIFENSGTAMSVISDETIIVLANNAFTHATGYTRGELENRKNLAEFFSPCDFQHILSLMKPRRNETDAGLHYCETTMIERTGTVHHIFLCLSPIPDTRQFIASFADISERKKAEEEVLRQRTELKRMNAKLRALFDVSAVAARSLDLHILLTDALFAITGIDLLNLERKGMVYVLDEGNAQLIAHIGIPEEILAVHRAIDAETALCLNRVHAASRMEPIIFCNNPMLDCAYAAQKACHVTLQPHIIVQLCSHNATTGIMCLYPKNHLNPDVEARELLHTISNQLGLSIENAQLYEKTKILSLHDPLTGLPNRRFLHLEIERNFSKAKRYGTPLALFILDIDNFKKYNDSYGHTAGDSLLAEISRIMLREIRESDLAVRYGGEEFLVLFPETSFQQAFEVAERIRASIAARTPVTVSIGVSAFDATMKSHEDIINNADRALYQAKAYGKNRVEGISHQLRLPLND